VTLNQNGTFSGAPTAAGNFTVPIRVTDDLGKGSTKTFTIIVNGALSITSPSPLETSYVGVSTNLHLAVQGGIAHYTWTLKNRGTLPSTINLSSAGRLSGTANATGNFSFTAEVADSRNGTVAKAEKQLTLPVINYNLAIVTANLPAGTAGSNYTATPLVATGGKPPYNWSFTSTPALSGLSASTGNLTGRPAAAGNYTIDLKVTDANSRSANRILTLRVNESTALAFDPLTLPNGRVATSYNGTLGAKGGFSPYTFTLKTGSTLPAGLRLATTGAITGTPTTAGTYKFFVVLKDSKTPTATTIEREFTLTWDELRAMSSTTITTDIHCVTKWSKFDTSWTGVRVRDLLERAGVKAGASYFMGHAEYGYTANLPLADVMGDDALVAYAYDGADIEPIHGGPVRLVVPHLYFWKSPKWLRGIEVRQVDAPGFWEQNGYHMYGDPFLEQRFWGD
jgi:hypothetical protein